MKPLPQPLALRTLYLALALFGLSGWSHAQGPVVITDPHQQVEQLMRQDLVEPALEKIKAHLAQRPRDPQMRFWQAVLLTRQGQRAQAMQVYAELTQDFPELAEPHNNLGVLQAANNDIDLAQRSFELALRADPQHALAHENLGDVLVHMARQSYERATIADPKLRTPAQKIKLLQPALELSQSKP
jgi:Flp pilus assembly protein TadD